LPNQNMNTAQMRPSCAKRISKGGLGLADVHLAALVARAHAVRRVVLALVAALDAVAVGVQGHQVGQGAVDGARDK